MASGLAVLAYDYAAARQFIDHGANGFLANLNEANSFVAAGFALLKEDVNLENLRACARQTTLEISWDQVTKKLENNYHDLILNSYSKDKLASSPVLREIFIKQ
jgi:glycosyltransferase involved in cell wall biosynthesis